MNAGDVQKAASGLRIFSVLYTTGMPILLIFLLTAACLDRAPWPNPARETVTLALDLDRAGFVRVELFDAAGRQVARPIGGEILPAGPFARVWRPEALAPGSYVLKAEAAGVTRSRRFVWLGGR